KSIEAGARFLSHLKEQHGTWDRALSAYNRGRPARNPATTAHVSETRQHQQQYLQRRAGR
ncbi:lytic transglycosylase domain-containing protein, partial [Candidatus Woesearchaeota archaeon]|nr:lytic transglycosylase domain-containing protein [Candidatus Woesearchaeota archaeon]